jgi:hypothetical protein
LKPALALAAAFSFSATAVAQQPATHFVVFNKPGANWERRSQLGDEAREHYSIYKRLADSGDIIVGGRMDGSADEPAIGMSVFRLGVDRQRVRQVLEQDALVRAGVTALEFREWSIQMGALQSPQGNPAAGTGLDR